MLLEQGCTVYTSVWAYSGRGNRPGRALSRQWLDKRIHLARVLVLDIRRCEALVLLADQLIQLVLLLFTNLALLEQRMDSVCDTSERNRWSEKDGSDAVSKRLKQGRAMQESRGI